MCMLLLPTKEKEKKNEKRNEYIFIALKPLHYTLHSVFYFSKIKRKKTHGEKYFKIIQTMTTLQFYKV